MARDFSPEVDVPSLVILLIPLPIELNLILAIDKYNDNIVCVALCRVCTVIL